MEKLVRHVNNRSKSKNNSNGNNDNRNRDRVPSADLETGGNSGIVLR